MRRATGRASSAIAAAERRAAPGETALAIEVAHSLFKLMAIKDEYEVARLYTDGSFARQLGEEFDSWQKLEFHLAPPLLARRDKRTGHLKKQSFGPWMMTAFRLLAKLRFLRGTWLDIFGRDRRAALGAGAARRLRSGARRDRERASPRTITPSALALAAYPRKIRGYGHVKEAQARAGARRARAADEGACRAGSAAGRSGGVAVRLRRLALELARHHRIPVIGTRLRELTQIDIGLAGGVAAAPRL